MKKWKIVLLVILVIGLLIPFEYEDNFFVSPAWFLWIINDNDNRLIAWAFTIPGCCNLENIVPSIQITYKWVTNWGYSVRFNIPLLTDHLTILGWASGQGFY